MANYNKKKHLSQNKKGAEAPFITGNEN